MNRKDILNNASNILITVLIPVFLSGFVGLFIKDTRVMFGITAGLAAAFGIIKLSGVLPRLVIARRKWQAERHIKKAVQGLKKMSRSRQSGVYEYALVRLKALITAEEYQMFLRASAQSDPDKAKRFYFQQLEIQEGEHEKR